jgi:DNA-binding GntR family transcriptional regulator
MLQVLTRGARATEDALAVKRVQTDMELVPLPADLERVSSPDVAARYIRRLIFDGQLTHGQRVPQDEIAQALGVSRIPVREALIALSSRGWVTIERNRGAFVNAFTDREVLDSYELYGAIGAFSLERALHRSGPAFVESLRAIADQVEAHKNDSKLTPLARMFHDEIIAAAQSSRVQAAVRTLTDLVPGDFYQEVPAATAPQLKGQRAVVRALHVGDVDRAATAYRRMLKQFGECVVLVFRARGLFE